MLMSVIVVLVLAFLGTVAENFFAGGKIIWRRKDGSYKHEFIRSVTMCVDSEGWQRILIPAFVVGIVRYLVMSVIAATWFLWFALIAFIAVGGYYFYLYYCDGDRIREVLPFCGIFPVIGAQLSRVSGKLASTVGKVPATLIGLLPKLMTLAIGVLFVICFWRKWENSDKKDNFYKIIAIILAIVLLISALAVGVDAFGGFDFFKSSPAGGTTATTTTTTSSTKTTWYHFYNIDLQYDKDGENDFNFGADPQKSSWTAEDYDRDFRARLEKDPALGAADIAWADANLGTRFLGEFYESCKHDWAKTINQAKNTWLKDHNLYQRTLVAFFAYLNEGTVEIESDGEGITDQMYMNPYTVDTIPDVIVMETDQNDGPFLVYKITIKGNVKEVRYRIPCGYQPTNVERVMNITPQKKPVPSSNYTPTKKQTNPTPTTKSTTVSTKKPTTTSTTKSTTAKTTSTTKPTKDPSQSNNSGQNDDPGPGEDTNTGVGSMQSAKEQPSNSNNLPSYDSYREIIGELEEANTTSPTRPTTVPSNVVVDDRGSDIDIPSPDTSRASEVGDSPARAWDGPAD